MMYFQDADGYEEDTEDADAAVLLGGDEDTEDTDDEDEKDEDEEVM